MIELSERSKKLLKKFVKKPYTKYKKNKAWKKLVLETSSDYRRKKILNQGRTDFRNEYQIDDLSLTTSDKVLIYKYHYFQFHYTSSLYVYDSMCSLLRYLIKDKEFVFIDIGCGPFTSGAAFKEYCTSKNINTSMEYFGYDCAQAMLNSGKEIADYTNDLNFHSLNIFKSNYKKLKKLKIKHDKPIIVNICYFLSAYTLDIDDFLDKMKTFFNKNSDNQILVIYQNPKGLNNNWKLFKQRFNNLRTLRSDNKALSVVFDDVVGSWAPYKRPYRPVYFDYLTN